MCGEQLTRASVRCADKVMGNDEGGGGGLPLGDLLLMIKVKATELGE